MFSKLEVLFKSLAQYDRYKNMDQRKVQRRKPNFRMLFRVVFDCSEFLCDYKENIVALNVPCLSLEELWMESGVQLNIINGTH